MNITGANAVVTGVSKGIGKATVQALLDKGAKVAGWGRNNNDIQNGNYRFFNCDVRDFEQVQQAYNQSMEWLGGKLDILVNNAGLGLFAKFEETSLEQWHQMYDTNVTGLFYCCKVAIPGMKEKKTGHIINIASTAALEGIPEAGAYCGSKHAVRGISHTLYRELKKDNIKVTAIYPGSVNTHFFDEIDSIRANESMMWSSDIALAITDCIEMRDNVNIRDLELRPMNPQYK